MKNNHVPAYQEMRDVLARTLYENFWREADGGAAISWCDIGKPAQQAWHDQADAALDVVRQHLNQVDWSQAPSWLSQSEKILWAQGFSAASHRLEENSPTHAKSG
jgi:DNA-binding MurR/RpiR family transcriptional regulator